MIFNFYKDNLFKIKGDKNTLVLGLGYYSPNIFKGLVLETNDKHFENFVGEVLLLDMTYFKMIV